MATSQTPNLSRRRPAVGDRAVSGAATPPGTDLTPDNTTEHHPGHRHARGTSPMPVTFFRSPLGTLGRLVRYDLLPLSHG
jgi:hypothetical protein